MQKKFLCCISIIICSAPVKGQAFISQVKLKPGACDSAAMQMPGQFKKAEDNTFNYWNNAFAPAMTKRTDGIVAALKETFPGPKGFTGQYFREMFNQSFISNGPKAYIFTLMVLPFGGSCKIDPNTHRPDTKEFTPAGETDDWMYFYVNYPGTFFDGTEKLMIQGKEHTLYSTHDYIGKWKGQDLFGSPEFFNGETWMATGNVWLMISRKDDKAFTHISRRQYLQALLDTYDEKYRKDDAGMKTKQNILNYLQSQPPDSLKLPVLIYPHTNTDACEEWFNPKVLKSLPHMLFAVRHQYWRNNEEEAAPQLITLRFRYNMGSWKDVEIKKIFAEHFPVEKLTAMLDK